MAVEYVLSTFGPTYDPCPPLPSLRQQGSIFVYHSGYNLDVEFFRIPCYPHSPLGELGPIYGAHLGVILDACEIIANNKPGFLGTSKDRTSGIPPNNRDLILSSGDYYYHLIDASISDYQIVTEFDAWTPPSQLPRHWQGMRREDSSGNITVLSDTASTVISQMVKAADVYCAMTGTSSSLNACHLVPKASVHWFMHHRAYRCFQGRDPNINDSNNLITLRADLNDLGIDQGHFVFVPIQDKLTVYFITKYLPDLAHEFHCRCICLPARIPPECLYYRFAWSVFQSILKYLLPAFPPGVIRVPVPDGILEHQKQKAGRKGTIKGKRTASVSDNHSQPSRPEDVEMEDSVDKASLLSQSDDDLEHLPDLSALYNPEIISELAAEDARIKKQVGPTLDESNLHLLSDRDMRNDWYPGFSDILCLKHRYLLDNPQVRARSEAATGRFNDGYESDTWGWADGEGESEEEEESNRIVSEEVRLVDKQLKPYKGLHRGKGL